MAERQAASEEELIGYQNVPDNLAERRTKLADLVTEAEAKRQKAADALALAESKLGEADAQVKETQAVTAAARETQVRLEATLEANQQRLQENAQRVREALQMSRNRLWRYRGMTLKNRFLMPRRWKASLRNYAASGKIWRGQSACR